MKKQVKTAEMRNVSGDRPTRASLSRGAKSTQGRRVLSPLKVFLSYAHIDKKYVAELRKDLKLMERNKLIVIWSDLALTAGEKWEERILQELNEADIIICQLSRDFLYSDFCTLTELDTAIERKIAGKAELIAYVLRDCGWNEVPQLAKFQILPRGGKHLRAWPDKDGYWRAVAQGIHEVVSRLRSNGRVSFPGKKAQAAARLM